MDTETGFDKIHAARLTALADHLETAETLRVGKFDFNLTIGDAYDADWNLCGTAGCALGEASLLWPNEFRPKNALGPAFFAEAQQFFGLDAEEAVHLFDPGGQNVGLYGGKYLWISATRHEVAANICAFLEVKGREQPTCPHCNDTGAVVGAGAEGLRDCRECRL